MIDSDEFEKQQFVDIGKTVAQLRYQKKWAQRDLGEKLDMSPSTINLFEKAKGNFKFASLQAIARVLGYRVEVNFVPLDGGETIPSIPNPSLPTKRTNYAVNTGRTFEDRKAASRKKKASKPYVPPEIMPGPQVEYDDPDDFDTEKEMAALRKRWGLSPK